MHLLVVASVESSARQGIPSDAAPVRARPASPVFRDGARAPPFVGCCLASIEPERAVFHPGMHHCSRSTILAERRSRSLSSMAVLSNRRNGRLAFLQVDCGTLQLAGNWPA